MSEFSQNGIISTLHDFGTRSTTEIEKDLLKFSKERKMELILPCLYSELEGNALPNIVEEISKTKYLDHIIVGLDKANEKQAKKAWKFFKKLHDIEVLSVQDLETVDKKIPILICSFEYSKEIYKQARELGFENIVSIIKFMKI